MDILGFSIDRVARTLYVPQTKRSQILGNIRTVVDLTHGGSRCTLSQLASLDGKLMWASTGIVIGAAHLQHLRFPIHAAMPLCLRRAARDRFLIDLSWFTRALEDLRWWYSALDSHHGVPLYVYPTSHRIALRWKGPIDVAALPPDAALFTTDASTAWGGGFVFEGCRRARRWRLAEQFRSINWLETVCVVDFVDEFGPQLRNRRVVGYSDSAVAVAAINRGRSTSALHSRLLMRLELACICYGIALFMLHIHGVYTGDGIIAVAGPRPISCVVRVPWLFVAPASNFYKPKRLGA